MEIASYSWKKIFFDIVKPLLVAIVVFVGVSCFVARVVVNGPSMENTLKDGEYLMVWRTHGQVPDRGDIVVCENEEDDSRNLVKRLIGLPGDHVEIVEDRVYVNGNLLVEPYAHGSRSSKVEKWDVPEGSVFIVGDNRTNSYDSRDWGFLPVDKILGVVFFRYKPVVSIGVVR